VERLRRGAGKIFSLPSRGRCGAVYILPRIGCLQLAKTRDLGYYTVMKSRHALLCAFWAVSAFLLSSRVSAQPVGVIIPMSGSFTRYGERVRSAVEGAKSRPMQFIFEDEGCNPRMAVSSFRKLNSVGKVRLFLGPWCGSPQVAVAALLANTDSFAVLGSSAPERVFTLSRGRMLAVQPSIESESTFNAKQAYQRGARRVAIVFFENDFSRAHEAAFRAEFKGEVISTLVYSNNDGSDLRALALKIRQLNPDTLYIPDAYPLMHGLLKQLGNVGVSGVKLMSVYSAHFEDVLTAVGAAGEGLVLSYPKIQGDAFDHYPRLATEVLAYGMSKCPDGSGSCVQREVRAKYSFTEQGVLQGELGLKMIQQGKYVWLPESAVIYNN
jgi:hypothetical protein